MPRLDRVKDRAALPKRGGIVWEPVRHRRGLALGYRPSTGMWFARVFAHGGLRYKKLGAEADLSYVGALEQAEEWFRRERGNAPRGYDVLAALEDYAATKTADARHPETARVWDDLRSVAKHIPGDLLGRELAELKNPDELERWRNALPVKLPTKKRIFNVVIAALNNAYRLRGVGDPAAWQRVKPIKIPHKTRSRVFIPTEKELADLLSKCEPDFALLVRGALHTGMRYGELAALEARDFDADKVEINLRVSKTGPRTVLLNNAGARFFAEQTRGKTPRAPIFTTAAGEPWRKSMQHKRMRAATPIRAFTFYAFRHLVLSRQLSAGIPSATVAKNAGTSEAMLRQHYHKFLPADRDAFDRAPAFAE